MQGERTIDHLLSFTPFLPRKFTSLENIVDCLSGCEREEERTNLKDRRRSAQAISAGFLHFLQFFTHSLSDDLLNRFMRLLGIAM